MIFPATGLLALTGDLSRHMVFTDFAADSLHNIRIITAPDGTKQYAVDDLSFARETGDVRSDLILSFNRESRGQSTDDTGRYTIDKSNYIFNNVTGNLGAGCAGFFRNDHLVEVRCPEAFWLGRMDDRGSFTIEFRFQIRSYKNETVLFSQNGYLSGERRGLEIKLHGKKVKTSFNNWFLDSNGARHNVTIETERPAETGRWYHYMVSYHRMSGRLTASINGEDDATQYITETGRPWEGILVPVTGNPRPDGTYHSTDAPPSFIGKNFCGYLDEFRISIDEKDNITDARNANHSPVIRMAQETANVEGVIVSPIQSFPDTGTMVTLLGWDEMLERDTFIWMEVRMSDSIFYMNDPALKWYRVTRGQRSIYNKKISDGTFLRGKYLQWRAHLVVSPDGKRSPLLTSVELTWMPDNPPGTPNGLEVVETGDEYVILRWNKNVEDDLLGYRIYYGVRPDRYDGIIAWQQGKRISNGMVRKNVIEIRVNNSLITENQDRIKDPMHDYPLLRNTVLYYFALTSYDNYKPDTRHNHESALSKPVTGRPYAGSEIDR